MNAAQANMFIYCNAVMEDIPILDPQSIVVTACRKEAQCQPNFRCHVSPKASESCGPYKRNNADQLYAHPANIHDVHGSVSSTWPSRQDHDTIAMVAIDAKGNIAAGASSNGASHKVSDSKGTFIWKKSQSCNPILCVTDRLFVV